MSLVRGRAVACLVRLLMKLARKKLPLKAPLGCASQLGRSESVKQVSSFLHCAFLSYSFLGYGRRKGVDGRLSYS